MDINEKEFIKLFEKMSDQNPLHESLLTYLRINPVRNAKDLRFLVEYMSKNHMLGDNMSCIYVQNLLEGTTFRKDFMRLAKEAANRVESSTNDSKRTNKDTDKNRRVNKQMIVSPPESMKDKKEEVDIDTFTSATYYLDWNHVRKGKKTYIFKPLFKNIKVKELILKPDGTQLVDIKDLSCFYKKLPPVRYRIGKDFNISQFEFVAFSKAIKMCTQFWKLLNNPKMRNKVKTIHKSTHVLDWNHIMGTKEEYIIQPQIFGLTVKPINIKRNKRPIYISHLMKKYANGLPNVTFRITENFEITGLNVQLVDEIIDFCIAKEKQWMVEETRRIAEEKRLTDEEKQRAKVEKEKRKRIDEENRKRKLQETYERLRMKGVDVSIFNTTFTLQWSDVKFYNRYFIFEPQLGKRTGQNKIKPLRVDDYRCKPSFNYIVSYFQDRLPDIPYSVTIDFKVELKSKPLFEAALADLTREQARVDTGVSIRSSAGRIVSFEKRSFQSALSKAASMKPEEFRRYKSKFIDFLVGHQMDEYKVVPVSENISHSRGSYDEASFIFTAKSWDGHLFIIIENVNPDRSTLLFKVRREMYMTALHTIFDYIQSEVINKRSAIRDGEINFGNAGIVTYWTFNHDSYIDWMYRLRSHLG